MRTTRALLIAILAVAGPAAAQERPGEAVRDTAGTPFYLLPGLGVEVTRGLTSAERVPAALSIVDRESIQKGRLTVGLEEALAAVPGVVVSNRHTFALDTRVSIRGFGARAGFGVRGIRLLVDGIPLTMPDGQAALTNLDLGSAGRIEVIRGPTSALYGNAAGGVISVTTEEAPVTPFFGEARVLVGDYGTERRNNLRKAQAKVGGVFGSGTYYASVSRLDLAGYREHSRTEQTQFNGRLRYGLDDRSYVTFHLSAADVPVADNPGALPRDSLDRDPRMAWADNVRLGAGKSTRQVQAGLTYVRRIDQGRLDVTVYGIDRELENPLTFGVIGLDRTAAGVRTSVRAPVRVAGRELALAAGVDLEMQRDERREYNNAGGRPGDELRRNQRDDVTSAGPFVQGQVELVPGLELTVGTRLDAVRFRVTDRFLEDGRDDSGERTLSAVSPMAGIAYAVRPDLTLYANFASSFQTPTTTELINAPPAPGQTTTPGGFNNALEPQRARSFELGVRGGFGGALRYDVAAYTMRVTGELISYRIPEVPGRDFFRNAGESRHRGIELAVNWRPMDPFAARLAYAYSDFAFVEDGLPEEDYEGNRLPGVAPHRLLLGGEYAHPSGVFLGAEAEHVGRVYVNDANDEWADPYTVVNVRLGFERRIGGVAVQPVVGVNNVLDRRYVASVVTNAARRQYFEPGPGRSVYLGLTVPYAR